MVRGVYPHNFRIFSNKLCMNYQILLLSIFICLLLVDEVGAQMQPENGASLSCRHVLFEWEAQAGAEIYQFELSQDLSMKALLHQQELGADQPSLLIDSLLKWGETYYWRVNVIYPSGPMEIGELASFELLTPGKRGPDQYRLRIEKTGELPSEFNYIFTDKPGIISDPEGELVWFHPDNSISRLFNLQIYKDGSLAYLRPKGRKKGNENLVYEEISLEGKQRWRGPDNGTVSGDSSEYYHHDFQLLSNGKRMLIGNEYVDKYFGKDSSSVSTKIKYGTLIIYDSTGTVLWKWHSHKHLADEDVFSEGIKDNPVHLNGFYYEEKMGVIYASFRYLDRVVKIDKESGKILESYGRKMPSGAAEYGDGLLVMQHSPSVQNGHLYLYDNRSGRGADSVSSVVVFRLPEPATKNLKDRYRLELNFGSRGQSWSESKGDIDVLPGGEILACMGSVPRAVLIDTSKGVIWSCAYEWKQAPEAPWQGLIDNYRTDWAETLYPLRFDLYYDGVGDKMANTTKSSFLINRGLASCKYQVVCLNKRGKIKKTFSSPLLNPGEKIDLTAWLKTAYKCPNKIIEIRVSPLIQPDYQKRIRIMPARSK